MAVIRSLEDSNFRVIVIRIDGCEVPLRFRPYLYADLKRQSPEEIVALLAKQRSAGRQIFRRHFVNRADELGAVELHVADPEKHVICLYGFYGIGKRMLAEEGIRRLWQQPKLAILSLSPAYAGARLALEASALAGLPLPAQGATTEDLRKATRLAIETMLSSGRIVLIDRLEAMLDEEGRPHPDIAAVLEHLISLRACAGVPAFLLSRRMPKFGVSVSLRVGFVRVGGLRTEHTVTILDNEARRIDPTKTFDSEELKELAQHLFGYPLAGRLAAPLLIKHSPKYLLENISHITSLRRDIAEAILTHAAFTDQQTRILRILALCAGPLKVQHLTELTKRDSESILHDVDVLAEHNVIEPVGAAITLHSLVSDFYWKQARSSPDFKQTTDRIADYASEQLKTAPVDSEDFLHWLVMACRSLFLCGRASEARQLRSDLIGELKVAAIELYQRQDYDLSLKYCEEYLAADPYDFDVALHRARNLYKLGRSEEALAALDAMLDKHPSPIRLARIEVARARANMEMRRFEPAKHAFIAALTAVTDWQPALQGMAELMLKMGARDEAFGFVEQALKVSPMDSFALSLKADLLWRRGQPKQAIETMETVVRSQPDNASFLFRIGRFLHQTGFFKEAHGYFLRAKRSDPSYLDVRMSLASVLIDLDRLSLARTEIEEIRGKGSTEKRYVLDGIEAQFWLASDDVTQAAEFAARALGHRRNVTTLGMMAKIEMARYDEAIENGMKTLAETFRTKASALVKEGLDIDKNNGPLLRQAQRIGILQAGINLSDNADLLTPTADLEFEIPTVEGGT
jgi:tetratricopeptide (TPR) repeat protein